MTPEGRNCRLRSSQGDIARKATLRAYPNEGRSVLKILVLRRVAVCAVALSKENVQCRAGWQVFVDDGSS
jgi:hypothetical protein